VLVQQNEINPKPNPRNFSSFKSARLAPKHPLTATALRPHGADDVPCLLLPTECAESACHSLPACWRRERALTSPQLRTCFWLPLTQQTVSALLLHQMPPNNCFCLQKNEAAVISDLAKCGAMRIAWCATVNANIRHCNRNELGFAAYSHSLLSFLNP
jgi:hypothetical protein